jgi:hypothetical protein
MSWDLCGPIDSEVRVDVNSGGGWARIPVTEVELTESKNGPADVNRTAEVKFPSEWQDTSVIDEVQSYKETSEYDLARVFFNTSGAWHIKHYGYVGSVGPAPQNGVSRMMVYDPADLMRSIQVTTTFDDPSISTVLNFIVNDSEYGIKNRTVFDNVGVRVLGPNKFDAEEGAEGFFEDLLSGLVGNLFGATAGALLGGSAAQLDDVTQTLVEKLEVTEDVAEGLADAFGMGHVNYQKNRHNLTDVMDWVLESAGGKWEFKPLPNGTTLVFDVAGPNQELFRGKFAGIEAGGNVRVLENDALYNIKPFNKLIYYGKAADSIEGILNTPGVLLGQPPPNTDEFPVVSVTNTALLQRAGGYEYAPEVIEGDKSRLENAERAATKQFRELYEGASQGTIVTKGKVQMNPYDFIDAIPVCNGTYPNANAEPLGYEIMDCRHHKKAGERYKTHCSVTLQFRPTDLEIDSEMKTTN